MITLLLAVMGIIVVLIIPCLIVGFWKKRPVWAFIVATLVAYLTVTLFIFISQYNLLTSFGTGEDSQILAAVLRNAIMSALFGLIFIVPLLFVFQWFVLRRHRRKSPKVDADETFS